MAAEGEQIDFSTLKSLMLTNIPLNLRDRATILELMSKFGEVQKVTLRNDDRAIVVFKHHADAALAKNGLRKQSPSYKQMSIQWCSLQRTSSESSPAPTKEKRNPFELRSNSFQSSLAKSKQMPSQEDFPPLSETVTSSKATTSTSASSSAPTQSKPLFGKRAFEVSSGAGNLFSRALQETASSASDKSSSGGTSSTGLFSQVKESAFGSKPFGLRSDRLGTSSFFGAQSHEGNASSEPAKLPKASSDEPSRFALFKKPADAGTTASPNFFSNVPAPSLKPPTTLFGKPVPAPSQQPPEFPEAPKALPNQSKTKFQFSRGAPSDGSPKRPPTATFPASKWLGGASTARDSAARPLFGPKPESGSAFGNRVWVKNATTTSSSPKSLDPRSQTDPRAPLPNLLPDPAPTPVLPSTNIVAPQKPQIQTRSQTTSATAKFGDLFSHSANTLAERYKALEMKDKILREELNNQPQTGPIKGTCPDMCPEKERYQRGDRNLVDKYEMVPGAEGVMDPSRMVKEYQRSSADKEFPLPHDLRSPASLNMTMNYLILAIISAQPPSNCGEWFTFVWNRTRAIRKDITQQEIEADPISTQILERCSRFHIHCAHSLCQEDPHSFDPKLNNENLTKCLKSLKYSYHDLKLEGVRCTNEPEFVAYEILMNLNDAGIAKTITDLEPEIRTHPYVKFAISAMYALHGGNYVRFFNLIHNAPYLVACILHRFFTEVRVRAVSVLSKSLNKSEGMQLSTLTADLYFNNENECASFIGNFGIEVDELGALNLKGFQQAESRLESSLSKSVAEKMGPSIAQVVYGPGEIPAHNYQPQDSFTADGMLKKSALNLPLDERNPREAFAPPFDFRLPVQAIPKPREPTDQELQPQVDALIDAVVAQQVAELSKKLADQHTVALVTLTTITEKVASEEVSEISRRVLEAELQCDRLRRQAIFETVCNRLAEAILEKYTRLFCREIVVKSRAEAAKIACSTITNLNHERIIDETTRLMVSQIAKAEYELCFDEYRENLATVLRSTHLARRCLTKWRRWVVVQKEIRDFPVGPTIGRPKEYRGIKRKSPSFIRQLQSSWDAMRENTLFRERVDNQPIRLDSVFDQLVRIVIIANEDSYLLEKSRNFFKHDPTVKFYSAIPQSLMGSNVVVVFPSGDCDFVGEVEKLRLRISPSPLLGVVWTNEKPRHNLRSVDEVLWKAQESPLYDSLMEVLKLVANKIPPEPELEESSLRSLVTRGIEHCLSKVCIVNEHLPTSVRLINDIIAHLAAVASSENLLRVNSLKLETGWNSRQNLSSLYAQVFALQLPVPCSNDRSEFLLAVEADKRLRLLTTKINLKDFQDDFTFLGHIYSQLCYTLNPAITVRYLRGDFVDYEVPEFWFARPLPVTSEVELTPEKPSSEKDTIEDAPELEKPPAKSPTSLAETKRAVQALLQRSERARTLRILDSETLPPKRLAPDNGKPPAVKTKRKSIENSAKNEQTSPTFRSSKQTKLTRAVQDLLRTVERLKEDRKLENVLKDLDKDPDSDIK